MPILTLWRTVPHAGEWTSTGPASGYGKRVRSNIVEHIHFPIEDMAVRPQIAFYTVWFVVYENPHMEVGYQNFIYLN